jgi:hypothetical protein
LYSLSISALAGCRQQLTIGFAPKVDVGKRQPLMLRCSVAGAAWPSSLPAAFPGGSNAASRLTGTMDINCLQTKVDALP